MRIKINWRTKFVFDRFLVLVKSSATELSQSLNIEKPKQTIS